MDCNRPHCLYQWFWVLPCRRPLMEALGEVQGSYYTGSRAPQYGNTALGKMKQ
jgi:hypothetical protein